MKRSGMARFAPLHVSKAGEESCEKQMGSQAVGSVVFRVDGDKEAATTAI